MSQTNHFECFHKKHIYIVASLISLFLAPNVVHSIPFPSGAYTSGSGANIPGELFDIAGSLGSRNGSRFNYKDLTKYAGFVSAFHDAHTNRVTHWMFPENPSELQYRPLPMAIDGAIEIGQFMLGRGIGFGYLVDANIIAGPKGAEIYCEPPGILADGKRFKSVSGSGDLMKKDSSKVIAPEFYSTSIMPEEAHLITNAKVVEYTTCGPSQSGPKRVYRLTPREHQQFRNLVNQLATVTGSPILKAAFTGPGSNQRTVKTSTAPQKKAVPVALPTTTPAPQNSPVTAMVADITGQQITLNKGSQAGFQPGKQVTIERVTRVVKDPNTGRVLRSITSPVGTIQLTEVQSTYSVGKVISGQDFKVGDTIKIAP
jgi:hypothetical protein